MDQKVKKPIWKKWWFWGIIIVVLIAWGASGGDSNKNQNDTTQPVSQEEAAPAEPALAVTAVQIATDYRANEIAADGKYKDKLLQVTGTVDAIGKDITDTMYVSLEGDSNSLTSAQCYFAEESASELSQLQKGQQITIQGTCDGLMGNVLIKDCSLAK